MIAGFAPLILIPICSLLNHLGGQSTAIPDPRIVCRVIGIPLAFYLVSLFCGQSVGPFGILACTGGMALWAVPSNGSEFMAQRGAPDTRNYKKYLWIDYMCDFVVDVSQYTTLTPAQVRNWGTVYGTVLGAFLLPMFYALSFLVTPWALVFGLPCLLQGLVYRFSGTVFRAEYVMGALIGGMFAATLLGKAWT